MAADALLTSSRNPTRSGAKISRPMPSHVLREHGTERAGTSPLDHEKRAGTFSCAGCGQPLFSSDTKFRRAGPAGPGFFCPLEQAVGTTTDSGFLFMTRTRKCTAHAAAVISATSFQDGPPKPTGLRYCMNGVAMAFKPKEG